jgi:ComF family protein
LPILSHHCPRCAKFLSQTIICGSCQKNPPPYEVIHALFPYEQPIIQLITALKFQHKLSHANMLGSHFIKAIKTHWYRHHPLPDLILPIPLHPKRLQERGFNQALEIAKPIARALHLPIDTSGLKRRLYTAPQSGLTADERKQNIANAFKTYRRYDGLTIALLDDVVTTGQTVTACSHALLKSGAKRVHIWCAARRG